MRYLYISKAHIILMPKFTYENVMSVRDTNLYNELHAFYIFAVRRNVHLSKTDLQRQALY
jgi:hypothetical protein